jgi:acyl carrier protein
MEVNEVISQVNTIFKDVLDNDEVVISADTTANDVDEWDSLTHIQLIVAIEKHFKIRFSSGEIQGFKNVGEMCAAIKNKLG